MFPAVAVIGCDRLHQIWQQLHLLLSVSERPVHHLQRKQQTAGVSADEQSEDWRFCCLLLCSRATVTGVSWAAVQNPPAHQKVSVPHKKPDGSQCQLSFLSVTIRNPSYLHIIDLHWVKVLDSQNLKACFTKMCITADLVFIQLKFTILSFEIEFKMKILKRKCMRLTVQLLMCKCSCYLNITRPYFKGFFIILKGQIGLQPAASHRHLTHKKIHISATQVQTEGLQTFIKKAYSSKNKWPFIPLLFIIVLDSHSDWSRLNSCAKSYSTHLFVCRAQGKFECGVYIVYFCICF